MSEQPRCYQCDTLNDDATNAYGDAPVEAGDVSVCMSCGAIGLFTGEGFTVRPPTDRERDELLASPAVVDVVALVKLKAVTDER